MCTGPERREESTGSPGTGVRDGCEPYRCWEWNLGPLQEQVLLIEGPFLQSQCFDFQSEVSFRTAEKLRSFYIFCIYFLSSPYIFHVHTYTWAYMYAYTYVKSCTSMCVGFACIPVGIYV